MLRGRCVRKMSMLSLSSVARNVCWVLYELYVVRDVVCVRVVCVGWAVLILCVLYDAGVVCGVYCAQIVCDV